jgi:carboxylate-amine ligase
MPGETLRLFEGVGIELEFMIVGCESLDVAPRADWLMTRVAGELTGDVDRGSIAWNNELALHVVEFKTNGPAPTLEGVAARFQAEIETANTLLAEERLRLLPTAMHPWMDPAREIRLWPYEFNEVYSAFDQIFDCRGHGWGNLQSMHVNLPFGDDAEFGRLHAAIRMILPLLPGLAASSPLVEGRRTELMDNRLEMYRKNCARVPSVTGRVIPEPVFSMRAYEEELLGPIYRDLAPYDPDRKLQHEWVNARGAIARFERMAIEIRVLDVQECPRADIAIANVVMELARSMAEEEWASHGQLVAWNVDPLADLLLAHIKDADCAYIGDRHLLRMFGYRHSSTAESRQLWAWIIDRLAARGRLLPDTERVLEHILSRGCLARRILGAVGQGRSSDLTQVYGVLADCLAGGQLF